MKANNKRELNQDELNAIAKRNQANAKALAIMQPKQRQPKEMQPKEDNPIITWDNINELATGVAVASFKTILKKSANEHIDRLYLGLLRDIQKQTPTSGKDKDGNTIYTSAIDNTKGAISDGFDVVSVAKCFLCEYVGKKLLDASNTKDKDGNPITILRATFRVVQKYINGERQRVYKKAYVEDLDNKGVYYEIPKYWDIPTATDLKGIKKAIIAMDLSPRELVFLEYRLRGYSLDKISNVMGVTRNSINKYRQRVKAKALKVGLKAPL